MACSISTKPKASLCGDLLDALGVGQTGADRVGRDLVGAQFRGERALKVITPPFEAT